jgi:hypothetical protein
VSFGVPRKKIKIFQEVTPMFNFSPSSYKKPIEPQIITKNGILVSLSFFGTSFYELS